MYECAVNKHSLPSSAFLFKFTAHVFHLNFTPRIPSVPRPEICERELKLRSYHKLILLSISLQLILESAATGVNYACTVSKV